MNPSSLRICLSQITSRIASDRAMYSASVEEHATIFCNALLHEIAHPDIMTVYPVVDFLVSLSPAQSLSENAVRIGGWSAWKNNPELELPLRYLRTRLADVQCWRPGLSRNRRSDDTACEMSGRVHVAIQFRAPTNSRSGVLSISCRSSMVTAHMLLSK